MAALALPAPALAEISEVRADALHTWLMTSAGWKEMPADYHFSLPYSTATGAYGITFGEMLALGYADPGSVCTQACFDEDLWEGLRWTEGTGIASRKDVAETPSIQDHIQGNRVLLLAALIDGYVEEGHEIGFRSVTQAGALRAASLIGAYGFRAWQSGGYTAEALPDELVNVSGMTRADLYSELIRRISAADLESPVQFVPVAETAQ